MKTTLQAPFPWFGGKRKVAAEVWARFGAVDNYVEPFFGSGAVLLGRPSPIVGNETINDLDGYVANFWRAIQREPEGVAAWADNPVNENDLHARHVWLLQQRETLRARLEAASRGRTGDRAEVRFSRSHRADRARRIGCAQICRCRVLGESRS